MCCMCDDSDITYQSSLLVNILPAEQQILNLLVHLQELVYVAELG